MPIAREDIIGGEKVLAWNDGGAPHSHGEEPLPTDMPVKEAVQDILAELAHELCIPEEEFEYSVETKPRLIRVETVQKAVKEALARGSALYTEDLFYAQGVKEIIEDVFGVILNGEADGTAKKG